jgi:hypothetical protein
VEAGDHERVVGAGAAEVVCPDALEHGRVADEQGARHAARVGVAGIEGVEAGDGGFARGVDPGERPATAVRAGDAEGGFRVGGGGPIDVAAGEVALEVEGAGVGIVARLAEFDAELDLLAVAQAGGGLTLLEIPVDAGARAFGEFDHGLLAVRTGGDRLDHAAGNLDHLAGRELDLGRGGGRCQVSRAARAIPGARVTATPATGTSSSASTDSEGLYRLNLTPGTYTVKIESPGFKTVESRVTVPSDRTGYFDSILEPAPLTEDIIVVTTTDSASSRPAYLVGSELAQGTIFTAYGKFPEEEIFESG